jgi:hypothetical protein
MKKLGDSESSFTRAVQTLKALSADWFSKDVTLRSTWLIL